MHYATGTGAVKISSWPVRPSFQNGKAIVDVTARTW